MMVLNPERLLITYVSRLAISKNGETGMAGSFMGRLLRTYLLVK